MIHHTVYSMYIKCILVTILIKLVILLKYKTLSYLNTMHHVFKNNLKEFGLNFSITVFFFTMEKYNESLIIIQRVHYTITDTE